jgi:hypothetical protein
MARSRHSLRYYFACIAAIATSIAAVVACGSSDANSAFGDHNPDSGSPSNDGSFGVDGGTTSDAGPIPANGIVIVHAASFGAFRLCLESALGRQPIPSADLLPDSNLLGVDVGSVVRIDPLPDAPQTIWAFAVADIVSLYPPGKPGLTCKQLLDTVPSQQAHEVANITDDLSNGVHLLVLEGSLADQDLHIEKITLSAFSRMENTLPVQVVPLSRDLPARAGNRAIGVATGLLPSDAGDAGDGGRLDPFVEGPLPFGIVAPKIPVELPYEPQEEIAYATSGFVVTLGRPLDAGTDAGDAGPREIVFAQSLADIQRLSAPRVLPAAWFDAASSYVLLLLGSAQETDAAADELMRLHFVAVPLAAPATADAAVEDAPAD